MAQAPAQAQAQPSSWNLVAAVAARSGLIAEHAAAGRARRQVCDEVVQALEDAGFMRAVLPKRWGGLEVLPQEFFAAHLKIAEQDMSTAWIAGIIAVHAYQLALMDEEAQADVYAGDPNTLISSSYNPVGRQGRGLRWRFQAERPVGLEFRVGALHLGVARRYRAG